MADLVTCPNSLTWQDVVGSVVYEDGAGVRYVNVFDSGVDISTLTPLDCDDAKDPETIILMLFSQDSSGNDGIRGVKM